MTPAKKTITIYKRRSKVAEKKMTINGTPREMR
jgi:hypothetical protein